VYKGNKSEILNIIYTSYDEEMDLPRGLITMMRWDATMTTVQNEMRTICIQSLIQENPNAWKTLKYTGPMKRKYIYICLYIYITYNINKATIIYLIYF